MRSTVLTCAVLLGIAIPCCAQTVQRRNLVRTNGDATVTGTPDQAKIDIGVATRADNAQAAAAQNASLTAAVLQALQQVLGPNADIKTTNYSLNPAYNYPPNTSPVLTGYTAVNTVEVTTSSLSIVGKLLDAATQAGANQIQSLQFLLKDPEPLKAQALRMAVARARAHADALVSGIGKSLGNVLLIQEGGTPIIYADVRNGGAGAATTTPIQPGTVTVSAQVTLEIEIL